jgi:DNA-binding MarR family transcriptional regulator
MRTSHLLHQPIGPVFKRFDLTQSQYNILRILRGAAPESLTAGTIKERMVNPKSDVTRLMDRLVAKGLISRQLKKDNRREMSIKITKKGLNLLDKIGPELTAVLDQFQELIKDKTLTNTFLKYLDLIQEQSKQIINKLDE